MHTLHYQVSCEHKNAHLFNIILAIPEHSQETLSLSLPAWIPGSYMIRDFAKNIINPKVVGLNSDALSALDKQSWLLKTKGQACQIHYQVYAFDTSVRTAYLDAQRGFFNGTSVFLQVAEFSEARHSVELKPLADNWKIATGLKRSAETDLLSAGQYYADNYAELIDCPVEMGNFDHIQFEVAGVTHHLVLSGKHYADLPRIAQDIQKICQHHINLFHGSTGTPPFDEYWFLTNILPGQFGGLEHKNSTALLCSSFDFAHVNQKSQISDGYQTFLSLISHEYFHAWNVCRIKPQEFIPYRTQSESYTEQLWAYEGITSYYDDFALYRCGLIDFERYLKQLSKTFSRVFRGQGEFKQNLLEASFYAWTKFYKQAEDASNNIVSYYTKGAILALWLDLAIRKHSDGRHSLDDFMRELWTAHGVTGKGTQLNDYYALTEKYAGINNREQLQAQLAAKQKIDISDSLLNFGVKSEFLSSSAMDLNRAKETLSSPDLGMHLAAQPFGLKVVTVLEGSAAELAGLSAKDLIIAVDDVQASPGSWDKILEAVSHKPSVSVSYFREQVLQRCDLQLDKALATLLKLSVSDENLAKLWQKV